MKHKADYYKDYQCGTCNVWCSRLDICVAGTTSSPWVARYYCYSCYGERIVQENRQRALEKLTKT